MLFLWIISTTLWSVTLATTYGACQYPTDDPLTYCPPGTLLVDPNRPISATTFHKISDAINSIPNNTTPYYILIVAGRYNEQLNITRRGPLYLLGQTVSPTYILQNLVSVHWSAANHDGSYPDNAFTSVITVAPNLNASLTGSGPTGFPVPPDTPFGNVDFRVYNVDFVNDNEGVQSSYGPALAVSVSRANAGFYYSKIHSYQDTVYVGKLGNAYFFQNEIAGQTDFLYGFGTAFIAITNITLRNCGGGITAWKGTNTTEPNKFGVYITNSLVAAANRSIAPIIKGKCALGRPWNSLHRSIFIKTYLDASILLTGYTTWTSPITKDTLMAEYDSYGDGWNLAGRLAGNERVPGLDSILNEIEVTPYRTTKDVFVTYDWVDFQFDCCPGVNK